MNNDVVKGLNNPNTGTSEYNRLSFIIQQAIRQQVNTCVIVKVTKVDGLYVDVLPLVTQVDGYGEAVQPTNLYHLPFFRYQAGNVAVKVDPVPGDIGLAVFAQKDCSNVVVGTTEPQQPASFRENTMANGFYVGGFLNQEPKTIIELKQNGTVEITASNNVIVHGDVIADGISLKNHIHGDVESGGSTTGAPQ